MNIDMNAMMEAAAAKILDPEVLKPKIEEALEKAVADAIRDAMGHSSAFREMLKAAVNGAMPSGFDGLHKLGALVSARVTDLVGAYQNNALSQLIDKELAELIEAPPAEMKVSALFAELTRRWGSRFSHHKPKGEYPTFIVERGSSGLVSLYLDKDQGKEKRECEFEICMNTKDSEILLFYVRGEQYEMGSRSRMVSRSWHDELYLTTLFVGKTKFFLDVQEGYQDDHYYNGDY